MAGVSCIVGSSGHIVDAGRRPVAAGGVLPVNEGLAASPPGHVGCFGCTKSAGPTAATVRINFGTTVFGGGCGWVLL